MARCEDFPCCGHEMGCCPSYDADGNQLDMKCVCGASVPLHSRSSLCKSCLHGSMYDGEGDDYDLDEIDDDYDRGMADPYGDYDSYGDYE